jgi:hypothetical protein
VPDAGAISPLATAESVIEANLVRLRGVIDRLGGPR